MTVKQSKCCDIILFCPSELSSLATDVLFKNYGYLCHINPADVHGVLDANPHCIILSIQSEALPVKLRNLSNALGSIPLDEWLTSHNYPIPSSLLSAESLRSKLAHSKYHRWTSRFLKRGLDFLIASFALLTLWPILLTTAGIIYLVDRQFPLFIQARVGKDTKTFWLYKFRTLKINDKTGSNYSPVGDPRITRLGTFLRRHHIDELPQLWNVFKGDMSIIGPRPEIQENIDTVLEPLIPHYLTRHEILPAMSGLAQISMPYPALPYQFIRRQDYDLHYYIHQSLWLDLKLILQTIAKSFHTQPVDAHKRTSISQSFKRLTQVPPGHLTIDIDLRRQVLTLLVAKMPVGSYLISSSGKGISQLKDSYGTPVGLHQICQKIGDDAPVGTIFKGRVATAEKILPSELHPNKDDDYITTRILWLDGLEPGVNQGGECDTKERFIYIHGSPYEDSMGEPRSKGCIRMLNKDILELFDVVQEGTLVNIHGTYTPK